MDLTRSIQLAQSGDENARAEIIGLAYQDLRRIAFDRMKKERPDHTLSATALVHEVSLKLLEDTQLPLDGIASFLAYVSRAMRNLLIDHARNRGRQKRGGERERFSFEEAMIACEQQSDELVALNDALIKLAEVDARKAHVVEMRYFGGLSLQETADALKISLATVKRDWEVAKVWLLAELTDDQQTSSPE